MLSLVPAPNPPRPRSVPVFLSQIQCTTSTRLCTSLKPLTSSPPSTNIKQFSVICNKCNTGAKCVFPPTAPFVIRASALIRISGFAIRHCPRPPLF